MRRPDDAAAPAIGDPDTAAQPVSDPAASPELTPREREVMSYVATGATNRDIARCLEISEGTVKSRLHRARLFLKAEIAKHSK